MALHHSFAGKTVLITGGANGIGRQLVQRFHDDGATVFTIDRNAEAIEALQKALPKVTAKVVDLADWDETKKVVESFGVIDHLVNNAGVCRPEKFLEISKEMTSMQMHVNIAGYINVGQVVAKGLISAGREGSIVNIASISARQTSSSGGIAVYGATKAAVENLTKSMALELGAHNIRVNAISPGLVASTMEPKLPKEVLKQSEEIFTKRLAIKKRIETNDVADLAMFLLSPLAKMIAGETVVIDGGYTTN